MFTVLGLVIVLGLFLGMVGSFFGGIDSINTNNQGVGIVQLLIAALQLVSFVSIWIIMAQKIWT